MVSVEGTPRVSVIPSSDGADERERDLVRRCVAGEAAAWRALYDRHFPEVDRLVAALGITDVEGDDLCQEIFLIVYRNLARFRGEARLSTWLYRLATREAIRFARKRRLRRSFAVIFAREKKATLPPDWSESDAGRRHYLRQLLGGLAPERRLALVLYEIEGMPVADIARRLNCAENTVWTRLHRARNDLEKLAKEAGR